ncbi:MAG: TolC family outer membrane protein [Magnetococcales bacterium]|nr:TolC family outer membrane protein [Magnetococcales bacterium]
MPYRSFLKITTLSALILFSSHAKADGQKPLSPFYQSVQEALASNNQIKQAESRLRSALTLYTQARSAILPTISLDWSSSYTDTRWDGGRSHYDPTALSLELSQPIFNLAALREMDRVDPQVKALEQDLESVRQEVYFSLISVTTSLLEAQEVVRLGKNNLQVTMSHLEATRARYSVGEVTKTDVSQAVSRVATAQASLIQSEEQLSIYQAQFQEISGMPFPAGLTIPLVSTPLSDATLETLLPMVLSRPDLQAAHYRLQAQEQAIDVKSAGHYPTVSLSSSGTRTWDPASSSVVGPSDGLSLSLSASLPLYSGGLTTAQTQQAKLERDVVQASVDLLREQAVRELKQVLSKYTGARASNEALKTAVIAAQEAREGIDQEYLVGSRTSLDLLDAQNELFSTQTEQIKSQFSVNLALFELLKVIGRLTPEGEGFQLVATLSQRVPQPMIHDDVALQPDQQNTLFPQESVATERWTVQVAAFRQEDRALSLRDELLKKANGFFVRSRQEESKPPWYLVQLGHFTDNKSAEKAKTDFIATFNREAFVTRSTVDNNGPKQP